MPKKRNPKSLKGTSTKLMTLHLVLDKGHTLPEADRRTAGMKVNRMTGGFSRGATVKPRLRAPGGKRNGK